MPSNVHCYHSFAFSAVRAGNEDSLRFRKSCNPLVRGGYVKTLPSYPNGEKKGSEDRRMMENVAKLI